MILSSAQFEPRQDDVDFNLNKHIELTILASENGAGLVVFPELSLTSYVREQAGELAFSESDNRLKPLANLAKTLHLWIVAGAPVFIDHKLYIASFLISPLGKTEIYTKQYLHSGEELFYQSSFQYNPVVKLGAEQVSVAICADINNPKHPMQAAAIDSSLYVASIFYSEAGIQNGHALLSSYATVYKMHVLMSNFSGTAWGIRAGGRSAFWDNYGNLIVSLNASDEGLLIVAKSNQYWEGKTITL